LSAEIAERANVARPTPAAPRGRTLALPLASSVLCAVALALVALFVVYPVLLLLVNSFHEGALGQETGWGLANWRTALSQPSMLSALANTITLAVTRQAISIIIAIAIAWLLARTNLPARNWLEFGFWTAVFMPQLTVTLAWIMIFDGYNGVANQALTALHITTNAVFNIYSWWGIVAAHLLSGTVAVQVMLLAPAFRNLDSSLEEASQTSGASALGTLIRIVVPVLAPAILVVTLLGAIRGMEAFETELVLGGPINLDVFSTKIYRLTLAEPPQYGIATALSMLVLLVVLPLVILQQWYAGRRNFTTISGKYRAQRLRLGAWRWPLFAVVTATVFAITILPAALVIVGTFMNLFGKFTIAQPWTLKNWQTVLANPTFSRALINTLVISVGSALLAMVAFTGLAYIIVRSRFRARGLLDFLVWLPSTFPGIILGLGFLWLFLGTWFLRPLYGTTFLLILVAALGGMTLTTQIVKANMLQLGAELEEASRASGAAWWVTLRRVVLPLIAPTVAVVGVLGFSFAARTTGSIALLSTATNQPLSMLQLTMAASSQYGPASVVGVFLMLLTVGAALIARALGLRFEGVR
jgi:iron(III) transport system permease protein